MLLEEAIRRNRRRLAVIVAIAALNYWAAVSFLSFIGVWGTVWKINDHVDVAGGVVLGSSLGVGLLVAGLLVARKVRGIRPRTIAALGAVEIQPGEYPMIDNLLAGLAVATGTHPVSAAMLADDAPNAMAVGSSPADTTVIVTSGLIEKLTRYELEAVLAVEMCAVRRFDTALQSTALACTQGTVALHHSWREDWKDPRSWFVIALTWPSMALAEWLRAMAFDAADFGADEMAVAITRHPDALDRALRKLRDDTSIVAMLSYGTAPLWFEPVPHHDEERAREFRQFAMTPTLEERRLRLAARCPR